MAISKIKDSAGTSHSIYAAQATKLTTSAGDHTHPVYFSNGKPVKCDYRTKLWEGTWSSGSITVPNTHDYKTYLIGMEGQGTFVLAIEQGSEYIRGIGGYVNGTPTDYTYHFAATCNGNTWTWVGCDYLYHSASGSHSSRTTCKVTSIIGLV